MKKIYDILYIAILIICVLMWSSSIYFLFVDKNYSFQLSVIATITAILFKISRIERMLNEVIDANYEEECEDNNTQEIKE